MRTLPHNAKTHYNYANYLKDIGKTDSAKTHYQTALRYIKSLYSVKWTDPPFDVCKKLNVGTFVLRFIKVILQYSSL